MHNIIISFLLTTNIITYILYRRVNKNLDQIIDNTYETIKMAANIIKYYKKENEKLKAKNES